MRHSTRAFLICRPNSDEASQKKWLTSYPAGEDCRSRVSRCPGGTGLYLEFLCSHMSKYFLELKSDGTSLCEGRRTTSPLSALLLLSLCAALDDGSPPGPEHRRHLVMTPTDTEKQMIVIAVVKKKLSSISWNN